MYRPCSCGPNGRTPLTPPAQCLKHGYDPVLDVRR